MWRLNVVRGTGAHAPHYHNEEMMMTKELLPVASRRIEASECEGRNFRGKSAHRIAR